MSPNDLLIIFVMVVGYSVPIIILVWIYTIALSFRRGAPYVPSYKRNHKRVVELLELKKGDSVVDLGSGDGRFIFYAAKKYPDVKFTGVELGPTLLLWSRIRQVMRNYDNVRFVKEDILKHDLSQYNKAYMYLGADMNELLAKKLEKESKDGTIAVSLTFDFGDEFMRTHDVKKYEEDPETVADNLYVWKKGKSKKTKNKKK